MSPPNRNSGIDLFGDFSRSFSLSFRSLFSFSRAKISLIFSSSFFRFAWILSCSTFDENNYIFLDCLTGILICLETKYHWYIQFIHIFCLNLISTFSNIQLRVPFFWQLPNLIVSHQSFQNALKLSSTIETCMVICTCHVPKISAIWHTCQLWLSQSWILPYHI